MDIRSRFSPPYPYPPLAPLLLWITLSIAIAQFSPYSPDSNPEPSQPNLLQSTPNFAVAPQHDDGQAWAEELRRQPAKFYKFDRALLRDVLRFLAEEAGIPYILAPETVSEPRDASYTEDIGISVGIGSPSQASASAQNQSAQGSAVESFRGQRNLPSDAISYDSLVTFTMRASPFVALEAVAKANDIQVRFQDGVWVISRSPEMFYRRRVEERLKVREELARLQASAMEQQVQFQRTVERISGTALIPRTYQLRHISPLPITLTGGSGGTGGVSVAAPGSIPNLATQSSQLIYTTDIPTIIREIRAILGLPVEVTRSTVPVDSPTQQNQPQTPQFPQFPQFQANLQNNTTSGQIPLQLPLSSQTSARNVETAVSYIPESNSIFVVATEEQHRRVAMYLANVDREQPLIAIEVKFFETTKDPSKDLGINWAGTFANGGLGFRLSDASIGSASGIGRIQYAEGLQRGEPGAASPIPGLFNYRLVRNLQFEAPYTAVLSMSDVAFAINAFMQDRETSIVQYPRVLTINNREVAISNAVNQPILGSSQQSQSTGATQTTNTINYLPIGTQLNILPQVMDDGSVSMSVSITVSSLIGEARINTGTGENNYPITSSRIYQATLQVASGYTLAVGGLEEAVDRRDRSGIPLAKDLPGIGYLFKNNSRRQNKRNLIVFITPTIIRNYRQTATLPERPQTTLPLRGTNAPQPPALRPDGSLAGGPSAIPDAIAWLQYQYDYYKQLEREARIERQTLSEIRSIMNTALLIQSQIPTLASQNPTLTSTLSEQEEKLESIIRNFGRLIPAARRKMLYP